MNPSRDHLIKSAKPRVFCRQLNFIRTWLPQWLIEVGVNLIFCGIFDGLLKDYIFHDLVYIRS